MYQLCCYGFIHMTNLLTHSLSHYFCTIHCTVLYSLHLLTGLFKVALSLLGSLQPRLLELEDFESIVMLMREWKRKGTFYTRLAGCIYLIILYCTICIICTVLMLILYIYTVYSVNSRLNTYKIYNYISISFF